MKTPIRIIVAADFKGTAGDKGLHQVLPGKTDDLIQQLGPEITLKSGVTVQIASMSDLEVSAIKSTVLSADATAEDVTAVLHDKTFQQVEGSLRGIDFLASTLPEEGVRLEVLDTPFDNLRRRVFDDIMTPDYNGQSDVPATIILGDFDFSYKGESFEVFRDLAKMGEAIRTPFVGQTGADFFNLKHLLHLPSIKNPTAQLSQSSYAPYHEFRISDTAFWACLMMNRYLMRAPYALDDYKEPASPSKPEQYLFGRGIWILGANLIKSFATKGHLVGISGLGTGGEQMKLPIRELPLTRTDKVLTPLEAPLPIDIVEGLPYLGLSPLSQIPPEMGGQSQPGMIYLHLAANMHQIPDPEQKQFGLLTVEASLAYSLMLGRITNLAAKYASNGSPDGESIKSALLEDMWTKESDEIEVALESDVLKLKYAPHLVIHTRPFEISLELPL